MIRVAHTRPRLVATLAAALALAAAACGGGDERVAGGLSDPGDLRGKTIGVGSLGDMSTLETRYLLQQGYGLDVSLGGGDVTISESPAESLPTLLEDGDIDAAVLGSLGAFRLLEDERFRVLSQVTAEVQELTGAPVMSSILVTYPEVAEQKGDALGELNRMLAESVTYFKANQDQVIEAVAAEQQADPEFLRWWWDRQGLALGDSSQEMQEQLLKVWETAKAVGDIEDYPELADVLFSGDEGAPSMAMKADRTTVSLALLDDPSRRAALYAVQQGIVTSDSVDVDLTYLPFSTLIEVAAARQYDVIEALPLVVPLGAARDLDFVVLSGALQDLSGTLLFVRAEAASD
ncbi:MAG: hypothetical protein A2148_02335 [Chloroflexi bacterium RBG_16_68_14]|nr:MAG: hypothetical protein A2148_02335 [Chloroflexi bacterium RBG_16_68_14]